MNMTPTLCNQIRAELEKVLPDIGNKFGISLKMGSGSYSHSTATLKVEAAVLGENGQAQTKDSIAFQTYATSFGLQPSDLGKEFTTTQGTYIISGIALRSYKFPILAVCKRTGKTFKFPAGTVARKLGYTDFANPER